MSLKPEVSSDHYDVESNDLQVEFEHYFGDLLQQYVNENNKNNINSKYNATLPSVAELMNVANVDQTTEELAERADIESLLEDALNEAQTPIDEILYRSQLLESQLIKPIDKPQIVLYVLRALSTIYKIAARGRRAAYCTYSHIPELNVSLHHICDGVDCYKYTKHLLLRIEEETAQTMSTIRKNVFSLAGIYKKIAGKESLLGKLATVLLNFSRILRNIKESYIAGINAIDKAANELPDAALASVNCSRKFIGGMPQVIEIVSNLSTCIMFVDNTTNDYDFLKPENERDFK